MQIKNIILYGENNKQRILTFELGKVNIITGDSKTGKSVLIGIVDYCIGSDYKVSSGAVNDSVLWFAILLQMKQGQVFIARPNPNRKTLSSSQPACFILQGDKLEIPDVDSLIPNATLDALKSKLSSVIGIGEYTHKPENYSRRDLSVTFKHSRIYCFQPQTDIDQNDFLFFHQKKDYGVEQAIKDTLPYFLGAVREDYVQIERELAEKKRFFNRLQRELKEGQNIVSKTTGKGFELITEAKQVELLNNNEFAETDEQIVSILNNVSAQNIIEIEPIAENENLIELQRQRDVLKQEMESLAEELKSLVAFEKEAFNYSSESEQQAARLESINLFEAKADNNESFCPLCTHSLETPIPTIEKISSSLISLRKNLEITRKERPKLNKFIENQKKKNEDVKSQITAIDKNIEAIYKERTQLDRLKDLNIRKGMVLGRISLYLESEKATNDFSSLQQKIQSVKADIEDLEKLISKDETEEALGNILDQISVQMSEWAKELELEFGKAIIQFSVKHLTLFITTATEKMKLEKVGSGENWVAYHLLIHFALHKYFINHNRPVPNFLMIDQFSQAYLPPEGVKDSTDNQAIRRICDFIFKRTEELNGDLQVIVTEHAEPNYDKFREAIVEKWRDGKKLIPEDWLDEFSLAEWLES